MKREPPLSPPRLPLLAQGGPAFRTALFPGPRVRFFRRKDCLRATSVYSLFTLFDFEYFFSLSTIHVSSSKCGLIFSFQGVNCFSESDSAAIGGQIPSSFHRLFQQKMMKTCQVKKCSFAPEIEIPARDHCVLLGVSLYVSGAGSWQDLHHHA